jgi:hypothetical protein
MRNSAPHQRRRLAGRLLCALVAAIFALAAQPGAMAMPAAPSSFMSMPDSAMTDSAMPGCDGMSLHKGGAPAKDGAPCMGMLSCYGIFALDLQPVFFRSPAADLVAHRPDSMSPGLSHSPEIPPPIA